MSNIEIAKEKVNLLTHDAEKSLYILKYDKDDCHLFTKDLYLKVKSICVADKLKFPLQRIDDIVSVNLKVVHVYRILLHLVDKHNIKLMLPD
jgi:hypothetical protein